MSDKYMNWFWYAFTYLTIVLGIFTTILLIDIILDLQLVAFAKVTGSLADIVIALANLLLAYVAYQGLTSWLKPKKLELTSQCRINIYQVERALQKVLIGPESREIHKRVINEHILELEESLIVLNTLDKNKYSQEVLDKAFDSFSNIHAMFETVYNTDDNLKSAFLSTISNGHTETLNNVFKGYDLQKFNLKEELDSIKQIFEFNIKS